MCVNSLWPICTYILEARGIDDLQQQKRPAHQHTHLLSKTQRVLYLFCWNLAPAVTAGLDLIHSFIHADNCETKRIMGVLLCFEDLKTEDDVHSTGWKACWDNVIVIWFNLNKIPVVFHIIVQQIKNTSEYFNRQRTGLRTPSNRDFYL